MLQVTTYRKKAICIEPGYSVDKLVRKSDNESCFYNLFGDLIMEDKDDKKKPHFMELNIFELGLIASSGIEDIIDDQIRRGLIPPVYPPLDIEEYKKSKSSFE